MMKRINLYLWSVCIGVGIFFSAPVYAVKWDMPTRSNMQNYFTQNIIQFTNEIKEATNGDLDIVLHPEDSLIKQQDVKRAVLSNQVAIGETFMSMYSNENSIFGIDSIPFLTTSFEENAKLLNAARPVIAARLEKQGLRLLFVVPWPFSSFYSQMPIPSVSAFKGVRFRAYNPVTSRLAELMEAVPVTVQPAEVSQAFSTGVIDAMITSPQTGVDTQAWDYVKYFTDVKAMSPWNIVIANERAFEKLDPETKEIVLAASAKAEVRGWEEAAEVSSDLMKLLENEGMIIQSPTDELASQLNDISKVLVQEWIDAAEDDGKKVIEDYLNNK